MTNQDISLIKKSNTAYMIVSGPGHAVQKTFDQLGDSLDPIQTLMLGTDDLGNDTMNKYAFEYIKRNLQQDEGYAWSWLCNLAMVFKDSTRVSHEVANRGAAAFMRHCFDVDVTQFKEWKQLERRWQEISVTPEVQPIDVPEAAIQTK